MATFREIDMSIHSLLDSQPVEKVETTAEEILEKYKQSEAEEAESKGRLGFVYTEQKRTRIFSLVSVAARCEHYIGFFTNPSVNDWKWCRFRLCCNIEEP